MENLGNLSIGDKIKWKGAVWTIIHKTDTEVSMLADSGIENPIKKILEGETK